MSRKKIETNLSLANNSCHTWYSLQVTNNIIINIISLKCKPLTFSYHLAINLPETILSFGPVCFNL